MEVTILDRVPAEPEIVSAWNQLVFQMERPEVFFTHQWAKAAELAFCESLQPLIFMVFESGRLEGVAALATSRRSRSEAFFLTATTADYCDVVSLPERRTAVLSAIIEKIKSLGIRNLALANIPSTSRSLPAIRTLADSCGFYLQEKPAYECRVVSLVNETERQAVLQSLSRKGRERRGLKKLGQMGPIQVRHLAPGNIDGALQSIFSAQISRFMAGSRLSPLIKKPRRIFLIELARLLDAESWLRISQMEVNGVPVAWNYGFRFVDSWFWYLPTFDLQYEESSPGSCLLRLLVEQACSDISVKRLDLGLGDENYKQRFSSAVYSTRRVLLSENLTTHLSTAVRSRISAAAQRVPFIEKHLRRVRDFLSRIQKDAGKVGLTPVLGRIAKRVRRVAVSQDQIAFFKAGEMKATESEGNALRSLDWNNVSVAAMNNADDDDTLRYLARCGRRLKLGKAAGFFLEEDSGRGPAHLLWADAFDGFHLSEIDFELEPMNPRASIIFDCWTPAAQRGRGHYTKAIRLLAAHLQREQREVWIFSAARNKPSIGGILNAGFVYNFSIVRRRILWQNTTRRARDKKLSQPGV